MLKFFQRSSISPEVALLYTSRSLKDIAAAFLGLFLPIFLFIKFNFDFKLLFLFYLISFLLYLFTAIPGARLMNILGIKNSLIISIPFLALFYLCFYFFDFNPWFYLIFALLTLNFHRMLYWIPYHTDFARLTDKKNRGRQIGFLASFTTLIGLLVPVLSGYVLVNFSFDFLFILVMILVLMAMIPLFFVSERREKFSWSYFYTWRQLFRIFNHKFFIAYLAEGAEEIIGVIIWPIFIWLLLGGNYLSVGFISTLVILFTVILKFILGNLSDQLDKKQIVRIGSFLDATGWLGKIFISTIFHIFLASLYHNFASIIKGMPLEVLRYEKAADSGHYVDEYTMLREMAMQIGKIIMLVLTLVVINFVSLNLTFILAALASLLINLLPAKSLRKSEIIF